MVTPASECPTEFFLPTPLGDLTTTGDPKLVALVAERSIGALATIDNGGRPHLSAVNFTFDPVTMMARICVTQDRVVVNNMRRDPRVSIFVAGADGGTYAVLEGTAELSPVAAAPDDDTAEELVEVFRAVRGEDHPDWDEYRAQMVSEGRLVARLHVESAYGLPGPDYVITA